MKIIKRFVKATATAGGFSLLGFFLLYLGEQIPDVKIGGFFFVAFFILQVLAAYGFVLILLHGDNAEFNYGHGVDSEGNPISFTFIKDKDGD